MKGPRMANRKAVQLPRFVLLTAAEFFARGIARKKKHKIFDWDDAAQMVFPGSFTIHIYYSATGEGVTRGLAFCYAHDVKSLRQQADSFFGSYFAQGAEIRQGLAPLPGYLDLISAGAKQLMSEIKRGRGPFGFHFATQIHANYS